MGWSVKLTAEQAGIPADTLRRPHQTGKRFNNNMAAIFCFTSTGNSLYTARMLAERIGGTVTPMNHGAIRSEDDVIGFVFPVYFWGLPRMVERFVTEMEITNKDAYVFAVATCGGPVFGVLGRLKALLKPKGIHLRYGVRLISVTNYLPEYEAKDSDALRQKIDESISMIAGAVNKRECNRIQVFSILNKIIYKTFPNERSDQYFTVASTCTGCETCQKVCPAKNIIMTEGKPGFQHRCEHCLACLHSCSAHAIDWKQKTQGKDRYRNAAISLPDLISFNNSQGS